MNKKIYLDYAASTPLLDEVLQSMQDFVQYFGNPSSSHRAGQKAKGIINTMRRKIAELCNCQPQEIFFTPSATISNNIILQGFIFQQVQELPHIIISNLEHPSILETALKLEKEKKICLSILKADKTGVVCSKNLEKTLNTSTQLVSITSVSSQIGTLQPIEEIGSFLQERGVFFHTDATQFLCTCGVPSKKVNAYTISSHKIYGPRGVAMIFLEEKFFLRPLIFGGGQERGVMAGSENLLAIVGFATALELMLKRQKNYQTKMQALSQYLEYLMKKEIPQAQLVGKKPIASGRYYLFLGYNAEEILIHLDLVNIYVSTGNACSSDKVEANPILLSMGYNKEEAASGVRITFGWQTTKEQINDFVKVLKKILSKLKK